MAAARGKQRVHESAVGQVKHGGCMQANAARANNLRRNASDRIGVQIAVTEHDALG